MLARFIALSVVMLTFACSPAPAPMEEAPPVTDSTVDSVAGDPASLVQTLYASYDQTARTSAPIPFSSELQAMIARADQLPAYVDHGFLEYDPYNGFRSDAVGQPTFENLTIQQLGQTERGATRVSARYVIWGTPTEVQYDLMQIDGSWVIDDMTHIRPEGTPWNLRRELAIDGITSP